MRHADAAKLDHERLFNCAQAMLGAYAEELGLDRAQALKVATGFGGGMGRMGGTCGVITGAYMVLGLKHGMTDPADQESKTRTYAAVQAFAHEFTARWGALDCRALLGVDISTPEGFAAARDQGLFGSRCARFLETAAELLDAELARP